MEKRKWLWKKKSSEKSPGENESSGSMSSHSERNYDDQQETPKESANDIIQSPEVTSKAAISDEEVNDSVKGLTEKLSAALSNISAKEDLVTQHAKVAEEAVAGWENAENEVAVLKLQLEAMVQQKSALEDRVSHLDGALKECVRQLRQAREEQEQKIHEAVEKKTQDWESIKLKLECQIVELQSQVDASRAESPASGHPDIHHKLESAEKENSALKLELLTQSDELEIRTIERDLSTQAAETASKQHLESIKKVAKLEAECRRLKAMVRKSSSVNDHKSVAASSIYVESLTDSQSDSGEQLNAVEIDTRKIGSLGPKECEQSCSDSWASALIAELDQFKNEKAVCKNLSSSAVKIDLMDDFLEMERIAALPETQNGNRCLEAQPIANQSMNEESHLRADLEAMIHRTGELEDKLEKVEAEKVELEMALAESQDCIKASHVQLREAEVKLEELQRELKLANESKEFFEFQLTGMEVEVRTLSAKVDSLEADIEKEQALSAELTVKCRELEDELSGKKQEVELQQTASSNGELKIKQEDLAIAAGKLAECQKTIASLGKQLKSLATLEDFLIDTANIPQFSGGGSVTPIAGVEVWKMHSNDTFLPKRDSDSSNIAGESSGPSVNGIVGNLPASSSSSSTSSLNHVSSDKSSSRNGFVKLFSRSKSGIQLQNQLG